MCPLRVCRVILTTDFTACLDTRRQLLLISTSSQVKGKENHNTKNLTEVINQHCSRPPLKRKKILIWWRSTCLSITDVNVGFMKQGWWSVWKAEGRSRNMHLAYFFLKGNQPFSTLGNVEFNIVAVFKYFPLRNSLMCTSAYRALQEKWHFALKSSASVHKGYTQDTPNPTATRPRMYFAHSPHWHKTTALCLEC